MSRLTYSQIEEVWNNAGGKRSLAPVMAAIAMAESGGNTNAHNNNPSTGDDSYGLWQINYYGDLRQGRTQEYGPPDTMYTPANNAKAAISLAAGGSGLHNWTTYTHGTYRQYLQGNVPPGTGPIPGGTAATTPPGSGGATAIETGISFPDIVHRGVSIAEDIPGPIHDLRNLVGFVKGGAGIKSIQDGWRALGDAMGVIANVFAALLWFANPAHWLRIISGFFGAILLGVAIYFVATS